MLLKNLSLFLQIVEKGSLTAAARESGLSPTTVSERLAALEAHYGVILLNRTTRAISLTDEGRMLVEGARSVLAETEDLENRIRLGAQTLSGQIRISAPVDLGRKTIAPAIDIFLEENPAVRAEVSLDDGYINIVDAGVDIAVRFGSLADSSLRARHLGENRRVVCASPAYLARRGAPQTPMELEAHNCLLMRFGPRLDNVWHFRVAGQDQQVTVKGNRIASDGALARDWCLAGYGIALKSIWDVGQDLESGALISLLDAYATPPDSIQMLFPPGRAQPRRVRALADRLAAAFAV